MFSLELVALIVGLATIAGAVDLIRQPGWAWKRAEESKAAYLILVVLVPIVGLALYVFKGRPKVSTIAAAGKAASLPFERFGETHASGAQRDSSTGRSEESPLQWGSTPSTGPTAAGAGTIRSDRSPTRPPSRCPARSSAAAGPPPRHVSRSVWPDLPAQAEDEPGGGGLPVPTVPAGWKADPTGRHQFRYWDGFHWTENVADAGEQSRDAGRLIRARPASCSDPVGH